MKILLENGCASFHNLGDIAMLQVALRRWRELEPNAEVYVPTRHPDRLKALDPRAKPIPELGQRAWLAQPLFGNRFEKLMQLSPRPVRETWAVFDWQARTEQPARVLRRLKASGRKAEAEAMETLWRAMREADVVASTGGGYITEAFEQSALSVLASLHFAGESGKPRGLFGQGLGPMGTPRLKGCARRALRKIDMLCLREELYGKAMARTLGVSERAVRVTGDDALELVLESAQTNGKPGNRIGLNIRLAGYSEVNEQALPQLQRSLKTLAMESKAEWTAVPVSYAPHAGGKSEDTDGLRELLGGAAPAGGFGEDIRTPEMLAKRASECRMVITGSYHAGVFALGQGVPVVGLFKSKYYETKFKGLADMFPGGCFPVEMDTPRLEEEFGAAARRAWALPEETRRSLIRSAEKQTQSGRQAYADFAAMAGKRLKLNP